MITSIEIITDIKYALKQFGEYTYMDKGASEVMEVASIASRLKDMSSSEIIRVLEEVENSDINAHPFLQDCCGFLDTWDDPRCNELFESDQFQRWY